jgi:hypothetical protein
MNTIFKLHLKNNFMIKAFTKHFFFIVLINVLLLFTSFNYSFAQSCLGASAQISMANMVSSAPNKVEFDIVIKNTGTTTLCVKALPAGFTYDSTFLNGGTLTGTITLNPFFSTLNAITNVVVQDTVKQVRWSHIPQIGLNCVSISGPGATANSHTFGHVVLTNTVPFMNCFPLHLVWNYGLSNKFSNTTITAFCNGNSNSTNLSSTLSGTLTVVNPAEFKVNCSTSVPSSILENLSIIVSPNPTLGFFTADINAQTSAQTSFTMFDITGRIVLAKSKYIHAGTNRIDFNMSSLANGTYQLQIVADNKTIYATKLIKR